MKREDEIAAGPGKATAADEDGCDTSAFPPIDEAAAERASESDRRWFKAHRGRAYRLRPAIPGELPGIGSGWVVLVKRLHAHCRVRLPLRPPCDGPPPPWGDRWLGDIWRRATDDAWRRAEISIASLLMERRP